MSSEERGGRVDLSARRSSETATTAAQGLPRILPPATVDRALAEEAARLREARDTARRSALGDTEPRLAPDDQATELAEALRAYPRAAARLAELSTEPAEPTGPAEPAASAGPTVEPAPPVEPGPTASAGEPVPAEPATEAADTPAPSVASPATRRPRRDDDVAVEMSVEEVARVVTASMRAVAAAHEHHLEAIELAAARRCELVTAQAELDAELIRLQARREAHAIITAAETRAGRVTDPVARTRPTPVAASTADGSARLREIGETFSRFAEGIETAIATGAAPHDPDRDRDQDRPGRTSRSR